MENLTIIGRQTTMDNQTTNVPSAETHNEVVSVQCNLRSCSIYKYQVVVKETQQSQNPVTSVLPLLPVPASQSINLPLYREMAGICEQSETVSVTELRELRKILSLGRLRDDHFQTPFERSTYAHLSCRYCDRSFGTHATIKSLAAHAVKVRHFKNVHALGRTVPRKDFEFWHDVINRAEQVRLEEVKKATANAAQDWETTVAVVPKRYHVPEITMPAKKFFYRDKLGDMQGPISEEQMQEWYRKGYFNSNILIGIGQKEKLLPFSDLLAENGNSTPFAFVEKTPKISESYAVLTYRPWYLIPMLHSIAVPSRILLSGEKLLDQMEKLREKFCLRNKDSLDEVLSHLLTTSPIAVYRLNPLYVTLCTCGNKALSMNCELCSTAVFEYSSEFVAHLFSRQHHEELHENLSGITENDIDYWNYVLDQSIPSDGPSKVHEKLLLKGRFRDEDGKILYRQGVSNVNVPRSGPQASVQKPPSAVQDVQTWNSENSKNINVTNDEQAVPGDGPKEFVRKPISTFHLDLQLHSWDSKPKETGYVPSAENVFTSLQGPNQVTKNILVITKMGAGKPTKAEKKARRAEDAKIVAQQYPQVPTIVPFFKLTFTGPGLTREAATSACKTLRGLFFRLSLEQRVEATMALSPRALTLCKFVGCPICKVALQIGQPFMDHVLGNKHIEKLYSTHGAITQGDVDFYTKIIQEHLK